MGYVRRSSLPDGYFHVYTRGVCGVPPFPGDDDRSAALGMLFKAAARFELAIEAACVLSTHYHAVLRAACAQLSQAMQWFHAGYAKAFNRRHGRFGHVFAERFQCRVIESEEYVYDACEYVLLNPVKAGLCERVEEWPWSWSRYPPA
jgi:REP element-mobilizing transposase RayT